MFWALINMLIGAFFLWMGAFQLIASMLPQKYATEVAEMHGKWMR